MDLLYLVIIVFFCLLSLGLLRLCGELRGGR
jgi:hypothetical protein